MKKMNLLVEKNQIFLQMKKMCRNFTKFSTNTKSYLVFKLGE